MQKNLVYTGNSHSGVRKDDLDYVFFHDILNRLSGLSGIICLMRNSNRQPELAEYIDMLATLGDMIIEDVEAERYLKSGDPHSMVLNLKQYRSIDIVESVVAQISFIPVVNKMQLTVVSSCMNFSINTDKTILKRILLNMAKNAAEASSIRSAISISAVKKNGRSIFSVNNPGIIPDDIRHMIFRKGYTTKGNGRGMGTYSMKLLGEMYLKGRVYFKSDEKEGTTFFIELPV